MYVYVYIYIDYAMSHGHQEGVCLQRQSSAEKSSDNTFPHKFLSVFKLHHDYSIFEATESHFIRRGQNNTLIILCIGNTKNPNILRHSSYTICS